MSAPLTDEEIAYFVAHADETRVPGVLAGVVAGAVLSVVFVAMRLRSRQLSYGFLRLDLSDYLILAALVRFPTEHIVYRSLLMEIRSLL